MNDLFDYAQDRKIIFVGDNAQLTPINMNNSPALDSEYIKEKYQILTMECELTEIIRQKQHSGILKNAIGIRKKINSPFTVIN